MRCPHCDQDILADDGVCPHCGHRQDIEDALLVCPGCSEEIPSDAVLCPHCGAELTEPEEEPATEESLLQSILSPRFLQVQAIAFFVWCLICAFCSLAAFFLGAQGIPWLSSEYGSVPRQATLPWPTSTPASTDGAIPTPDDASAPTPTPPAIAPSYWEIEENMKALDRAEWDGYVKELEGTWANNWIGWIEDIHKTTSGEYELRVDVDSPDVIFSGHNVTFGVSDEVAQQVEKGQQITFSGRIESVENVLGSLQIRLQDVEWSIDE
jgi:hypothetical protein